MERNFFEQLKAALEKEPVLFLFRIGAELQLHTDACVQEYGAILMQRNSEDQRFHQIYYTRGTTT